MAKSAPAGCLLAAILTEAARPHRPTERLAFNVFLSLGKLMLYRLSYSRTRSYA